MRLSSGIGCVLLAAVPHLPRIVGAAEPAAEDRGKPAAASGAASDLPDPSGMVEKKRWWKVHPAATIVGGVQYETLGDRQGYVGDQPLTDEREGRVVTLALSRFGLRGWFGEHVYVESEIEINAGPHGTSVWEGQAALQIRNQLLRLSYWGAHIDLGRITDESSVDYHSQHVTDLLLADPFTLTPLLESGYNRGNGAWLRYAPLAGLEVGVSLNAANPTSSTGGYLVAGKFSNGLFSRLYLQSGQRIADSPNKYPEDTTHLLMLTPALRYASRYVDAQLALQLLWANIDTSVPSDDPSLENSDDTLRGHNLRGGVRARLWGGRVVPFVNASWLRHDMLAYKSEHPKWIWPGNAWQVLTLTTGVDVSVWGRSGVGIQYSQIFSRQGDGTEVKSRQHYVNIGGTFWIVDTVALAARFAMWSIDSIDQSYNSGTASWENVDLEDGERSVYFTMRKVF